MKHFLPYIYQFKAIAAGLRSRYLALFLDPGLGKTVITLRMFYMLKKKKKVKGMLVVAPLRPCYSVWPPEKNKWFFSKHFKVNILHGNDKLNKLREEADIYVINPEGLNWLFKVALKGKRNWPFDMLVVDESGKFRNPSSKRLGYLKPKLNKFTCRYILNGTPAPKSLLDIWSQLLIVDMGHTFGRKITHYKNQYFHKSGYKGKVWEINDDKAKESIYKRASKIALVMESKDCLDLPPITFPVRVFDLPKKAQTIYDEVENELFTAFDHEGAEAEIEIKNKAVSTGACRQIASGALYKPRELGEKLLPSHKREVFQIHKAKVSALVELIEELQGKPLLIAYDFYHSLVNIKEAVKKLLGFTPPHIGKNVSPKAGTELERKWNSGQLPVLLLSPQSTAHGLNLQGSGNDLCWFDPTWDLEMYIQMYQRIYRNGVTGKVRIHHLIAAYTIEELMMERLDVKSRNQQSFKTAVQKYRQKKANRRIAR